MKLLALLLLVSACASAPKQDATLGTDVKVVEPEMVPFDPPRKLVGIDAQRIFEATVDEDGMTQSEFSGLCTYQSQNNVNTALSFSIGDEPIDDAKLMNLMCRHAWKNYTSTEAPDHDDVEENILGMTALLNMQCERIEERNRPKAFECEFMQLKPVP